MVEHIKKNAVSQTLSIYTVITLLSGLGYFGKPWLSMVAMIIVLVIILMLIYFIAELSSWKIISALSDGLNSGGLLILFGHFSDGYISISSGFFPLPDYHWLYYLALLVLGFFGKLISDSRQVA